MSYKYDKYDDVIWRSYIQMLINKGALVNEKDNMSNTPMHCAALHGQNTIMCLLVSNGANCCELGENQTMILTI